MASIPRAGRWPSLSHPIFSFPFQDCGCPVLALLARAGTMLPIPWDLPCLVLRIALMGGWPSFELPKLPQLWVPRPSRAFANDGTEPSADQHRNVSLSLMVCAFRSGRFARGLRGTAVDAPLAHPAHGHRQEQSERRDMDKQYCRRPICLRKAAH